MKIYSCQLFYLNSFKFLKIKSKYVKFKIQILQTISDEKSVNIELCSWLLFYLNSLTVWNKEFTLNCL
jgi:hypothetical protein